MQHSDHPGVIIPPTLLYILMFLFSLGVQSLFPLASIIVKTAAAYVGGFTLLSLGLILVIAAFIQFVQTENSVMTVIRARLLQTTGIYSLSRNPMYLGYLLIYIGVIPFLWKYMDYNICSRTHRTYLLFSHHS